jgi:hypothetical protein
LHGPEAWVKKYAPDITGTGIPLDFVVGEIVREVMTSGMDGILVEHDGTRPFLTHYLCENVTNMLADGTVVLRGTKWEPKADDRYTLAQQTFYREIAFVEGKPVVNLWTKPEGQKDWGIESTKVLVFRGTPLAEIPFVLASLPSLPLLPLAQANLSHYLTSADLENGLHWGGIFTPWIASNLDPDDPRYAGGFKVGGSSAWMLPERSQVGMLEVTGAALEALEARLLGKQQLMTSLGARLLIEAKRTAETAETVRINASGEGATLTLVVDTVEMALTKALRMMARWDGLSDSDVASVSLEMNRDFVDAKLGPDELTAYLATYQAGGMSLDTFLTLLQGGEILPVGRTVEEEKQKIDEEGAGGPGGGPAPFGRTPGKAEAKV